MNGIVRHNDNRFSSSPELLAEELSTHMRAALLTAEAAPPEPEWDYPADYCTGHESLRGDMMGATQYCEGDNVCHQAREAYAADRQVDPGRLVIVKSDTVKLATVVALLARGLVGPLMRAEVNYNPLTELGVAVLDVLKAQR